ncbi:hypothetical protein K2173_001001 [Erythroxylum novogranatense]|uniref:Signal peptidase complex-like protein DTM1 n=1 Tax=Erythroxylum novogranatense TaxID=1862640 RepID=A0AAV8S5S1_9ROSI|nr:hypothetical protein K2173_001001 [Erythroxylum novogranatense]
MANDSALRNSLVWLAAVVFTVFICTHSFKKMVVTYILGVLGIAGILLPDWDFFDRDYSRWFYPVTEEEKLALAQRSGFRNRISPLRVVVYTTIYSYALYKWWIFITS